MKIFYIYHIPGVKIGCTTEPNKRIIKDQGFGNYEILEQHTDIYIASDREQELQRQYGYKVDASPYWNSYQSRLKASKLVTIEQLTNMGKKGGKVIAERFRNAEDKTIFMENFSNAGKIGHLKGTTSNAGKIAGQMLYWCEECNREYKAAGPAGKHKKKSGHNLTLIKQ